MDKKIKIGITTMVIHLKTKIRLIKMKLMMPIKFLQNILT